MQDCIVKHFESPDKIEEMDIGLEKLLLHRTVSVFLKAMVTIP